MSKSIIQKGRYCFLSGEYADFLHKHHIFGGGLRNWSEREGLWVYLLPEEHMKLHITPETEQNLKRVGQFMYEKYHSREEFMRKVRKNYLTIPFSDEEIKKFGLVEYEPYNIADDDIERILGK